DEGRYWFRVVAGMAAGDDQRVAGVTIFAAHGHPGQVQHVQHVGVELLVGQADAQHVEVANGVFGLQRGEGYAPLAHHLFHVGPRREDALGQQVAVRVDDVVERHQPQVGHADVVDVGEGQGNAEIDLVPILDYLVILAPSVATRFADAR